MPAKIEPVSFVWRDDDVMAPISENRGLASRQYAHGKKYRLVPYRKRSPETHNQLFAAAKKTFDNLPEQMQGRWSNPAHMRYHSLIELGYCKQDVFVCGSAAEAQRNVRIALFSEPYALVKTTGPVMRVFIADSMRVDEDGSRNGMDRATFQEAKQRCLELWASWLDVTVKQLLDSLKDTE